MFSFAESVCLLFFLLMCRTASAIHSMAGKWGRPASFRAGSVRRPGNAAGSRADASRHLADQNIMSDLDDDSSDSGDGVPVRMSTNIGAAMVHQKDAHGPQLEKRSPGCHGTTRPTSLPSRGAMAAVTAIDVDDSEDSSGEAGTSANGVVVSCVQHSGSRVWTSGSRRTTTSSAAGLSIGSTKPPRAASTAGFVASKPVAPGRAWTSAGGTQLPPSAQVRASTPASSAVCASKSSSASSEIITSKSQPQHNSHAASVVPSRCSTDLLASSSDSDTGVKQPPAPPARGTTAGGEVIVSCSFSIGSDDDSTSVSASQDSAAQTSSRSRADSESEESAVQQLAAEQADAQDRLQNSIAEQHLPADRRHTQSSMGASQGIVDDDFAASSLSEGGQASPRTSRGGSSIQHTQGKGSEHMHCASGCNNAACWTAPQLQLPCGIACRDKAPDASHGRPGNYNN
jgi:hypothetical protein